MIIRILVAVLVLLSSASSFAADRLSPADRTLKRAYEKKISHFFITFDAKILTTLPDDLRGDRHQQFLIQLRSEQTLLVAHNIDIAPRVKSLKADSRVKITGEYIWSRKGGIIHFTHHDPEGSIAGGWILYQGRRYE